MGKRLSAVAYLKEHPEDISIEDTLAMLAERKKKQQETQNKEMCAVDWLIHHPEDIPMAKENLQARDRGYDDEGFRQLLAAVCLNACVDYKKATMGKKVDKKYPEQVIDECHKFFNGDIFQFFINRVPVDEVERVIRATQEDAIKNIWYKNENGEQSKEHLVAKNATPIIEE